MKMTRLTKRISSFVVVMSIAALGTTVWAAASIQSGRMEQVTTQTGGPKTLSMKTVTTWSGNKFRSEMINGSQKRIVIGDGKNVYFYDPASKSAVSGGEQPPQATPANAVKGMSSMAKALMKDAKKTGSEKVGGFNCDIYTVEQTIGKQKVTRKMWINKDSAMPIPVKTVATAGKRKSVIEIKSLKLGGSYPASLFTLPKGTKIQKHPPMGMPHSMPNPHKPGAAPKK